MAPNHTDRSFREYYSRTIAENNHGFKLVLGGTGLGKTSGIVELLKTTEVSRKFIYCANRIQLLDEMAQTLTEKLGTDFIVTLLNNTDVVYTLKERILRTVTPFIYCEFCV